jgi:hypothetical protein
MLKDNTITSMPIKVPYFATNPNDLFAIDSEDWIPLNFSVGAGVTA